MVGFNQISFGTVSTLNPPAPVPTGNAESIVEAFIQIVGWIAEIPVRLLTRIFRLDQEKAVRSWYGRLVTGLSALIAALAGLFYVLEFLGFKDAVLRWLKLK